VLIEQQKQLEEIDYKSSLLEDEGQLVEE